MDFNILSLNREPGNSAHIIYNKNTENGKETGREGRNGWRRTERGGGTGRRNEERRIATYGDRGDLGQDPTVAASAVWRGGTPGREG